MVEKIPPDPQDPKKKSPQPSFGPKVEIEMNPEFVPLNGKKPEPFKPPEEPVEEAPVPQPEAIPAPPVIRETHGAGAAHFVEQGPPMTARLEIDATPLEAKKALKESAEALNALIEQEATEGDTTAPEDLTTGADTFAKIKSDSRLAHQSIKEAVLKDFDANVKEILATPRETPKHVQATEHPIPGEEVATLEDAKINNLIANIVTTPPEKTPEFIERMRADREAGDNALRSGEFANRRREQDEKESALANNAIRQVAEREKERIRSKIPTPSTPWTGRAEDAKNPAEMLRDGVARIKARDARTGAKIKEQFSPEKAEIFALEARATDEHDNRPMSLEEAQEVLRQEQEPKPAFPRAAPLAGSMGGAAVLGATAELAAHEFHAVANPFVSNKSDEGKESAPAEGAAQTQKSVAEMAAAFGVSPQLAGREAQRGSEKFAKAMEGLKKQGADIDAQAEKSGVGKFLRDVGAGYNKLNWKVKLGVGLGLTGAAILSTPVSAGLAAAFGSVAMGQRLFGGLGMFVKFEKHLQETSQGKIAGGHIGKKLSQTKWYKALAEGSDTKRMLLAAGEAGLYMLGFSAVVGEIIHVGGQEFSAFTDWLGHMMGHHTIAAPEHVGHPQSPGVPAHTIPYDANVRADLLAKGPMLGTLPQDLGADQLAQAGNYPISMPDLPVHAVPASYDVSAAHGAAGVHAGSESAPAPSAETAPSAPAAPAATVEAPHVVHHPEGLTLNERDALERMALNKLQEEHPGVVSTPEEITEKMNALLAEHMKHAEHVDMLNAHRANLNLQPVPKPELVPQAHIEQPAAPESVQPAVHSPTPTPAPVVQPEQVAPAPSADALAGHTETTAPIVGPDATHAPTPLDQTQAPAPTISPFEGIKGINFAMTHSLEPHLYADEGAKHFTLWGGTPDQQTLWLGQHAAEHPGSTIDGTDSTGKWLLRYSIDKNGNVGLPQPIYHESFWAKLGIGPKTLMEAPDPKNLPDAFKTVVE